MPMELECGLITKCRFYILLQIIKQNSTSRTTDKFLVIYNILFFHLYIFLYFYENIIYIKIIENLLIQRLTKSLHMQFKFMDFMPQFTKILYLYWWKFYNFECFHSILLGRIGTKVNISTMHILILSRAVLVRVTPSAYSVHIIRFISPANPIVVISWVLLTGHFLCPHGQISYWKGNLTKSCLVTNNNYNNVHTI